MSQYITGVIYHDSRYYHNIIVATYSDSTTCNKNIYVIHALELGDITIIIIVILKLKRNFQYGNIKQHNIIVSIIRFIAQDFVTSAKHFTLYENKTLPNTTKAT